MLRRRPAPANPAPPLSCAPGHSYRDTAMTKLLAAAAVLAALSLSSCVAGPKQLLRSVDDWDRRSYVDNPWLNAGMWLVPVFPVCFAGAALGDFCVGNVVAFWGGDAWDGMGTGYQPLQVLATDGQVDSMLDERSGWMVVRK